MDMGLKFGQIIRNTEENIVRVRKKDLVYTHGQMARNTLASGKTML